MAALRIDWANTSFLIGYHLFLLFALPLYLFMKTPSAGLLSLTGILILCTGLGITAGYHRLYAHKSYKANKVVEVLILWFATMASQGSAL
ncbi:acyl-CoA desaturase, partial [Candidatus Woesearchaeota archaeon]